MANFLLLLVFSAGVSSKKKKEARPRKGAGKEKWACGSPSLDYQSWNSV